MSFNGIPQCKERHNRLDGRSRRCILPCIHLGGHVYPPYPKPRKPKEAR